MDRIHEVDHLLQTGIDLMEEGGYHNTSINDVIETAGLPKGSFYYLYPDKKSFALAAVEHYGDQILDTMESFFNDDRYSPLEAIVAYYTNSARGLRRGGYSCGCFLGNMGQEMADVDEDFRKLINRSFGAVHRLLKQQLVLAQEMGEVRSDADPAIVADMIINMWHGSLVRMKASRTKKSLDIFLNDFFMMLRCNE